AGRAGHSSRNTWRTVAHRYKNASASPSRDAAQSWSGVGVCHSNEGGRKMKTVIIALSAAVLIAAAPAVLCQRLSSKTLDQQQHATKKHVRGVASCAQRPAMHAKGLITDYPGAFGYAPSAPKEYTYENSRNGGGGGSGM